MWPSRNKNKINDYVSKELEDCKGSKEQGEETAKDSAAVLNTIVRFSCPTLDETMP